MWSNPTYNEERGVFCIMMELHGFDLDDKDEDPAVQKLLDRMVALTMLISSQVVLVSKGRSDGLQDAESLLDLKFMERIQHYIAVGANISDNFDQMAFKEGL
jgi:hypothetical protein